MSTDLTELKISIIKYFVVFSFLFIHNTFAQRFCAYYTNVGENLGVLEMVQDKLFGKYADVIVEVGHKGQLQFTKNTSYLPVWSTDENEWNFEELIKRTGDGQSDRPDIISQYSHARIINNSSDGIIVHWRYFPDFNNVEWDGVVDEYFIITPDGKVTRTIRQGKKRIDDWNNQSNLIVRNYWLTKEGIIEIKTELDLITNEATFNSINSEVIECDDSNPSVKLSFDDGLRHPSKQVTESVAGIQYNVNGHKALWKKGISGSALHFDGYYSSILISNPFKNKSLKNLTIEGWVALAAYPFGWAPIIHQSKWNNKGFYFGVNEKGFLGFHCLIGNDWYSIIDSTQLSLFEWYQVAASFNKEFGTISLYVDGMLKKEKKIPQENLIISESDLVIGLNSDKMPAIDGRIRIGKWPSLFGIDGLIDEIKLYDRTLSDNEIENLYLNLKPDEPQKANPDMQERKLPQMNTHLTSNRFGANYTKLDYYDTWDNMWRVSEHPDLVVSFDQLPVNIVLWRGASYGPYFVTENGKWIGDQSNEDYRLLDHPGEAEGCLEHMSDKQCRHSHARIIENTDARVLIHWRYGLVDSRYLFAPGVDGWGGWTDEYWTIYPDGVAIRHVPRGIVFGDGWVETMFFSEPGTVPEDNCELDALTIIVDDGESTTLSWKEDSPEGEFDDVQTTMVNSKSEYRMFNIYPSGSSVEVFGGHSGLSHFHWWNHWPVSQITSDGRGALAPDRAAHSSLIWGAPNGNFLLYGITDKPAFELTRLAKSWNHPPEIINLTGNSVYEYIQSERAYHISSPNEKVKFKISANKESPLVNPSFVIYDWKGNQVQLKINGETITGGKEFRTGFVITPEGKNLIVWLAYNSIKNSQFEFLSIK
ncbi:MAG: LamG domain-containing protein [Ignavibacteriaceae bacterium]